MVSIFRSTLGQINTSHQDMATHGKNCVHFHISNVAILKIASYKLPFFSIEGVAFLQKSLAVLRSDKSVATFYWRTQRHIFLELPFLSSLVLRILPTCTTEQLDFRKIFGLCNLIKRGEARTHRLTKYYSIWTQSALFTQETCLSLLPLVTNGY